DGAFGVDLVDDDVDAAADLCGHQVAAHLLLGGHEAVTALLLHLVGYDGLYGVGRRAGDGLVLETADAGELGLLQPVEQDLEVGFRLTGEADDEGGADGEVG